MKQRRNLAAVALCSIPFAFGGCAAALIVGGAALGAGAITFIDGELRVVEEIPYERAWEATQEAVKEMRLDIKEEKSDALSSKMLVLTASGKQVSIIVRNESVSAAKIGIRVGVFGDEALSRHILQQIRDQY